MSKKILAIVALAEKLLSSEEKVDWDKELDFFARWIGYFQHERLVHLIVTCLFSLLTILSMMINLYSSSLATLILFLLFFILLIPYIGHYYLLENKTQYLYDLYDKMIEKACEAKKGGN